MKTLADLFLEKTALDETASIIEADNRLERASHMFDSGAEKLSYRAGVRGGMKAENGRTLEIRRKVAEVLRAAEDVQNADSYEADNYAYRALFAAIQALREELEKI